MPCYFITKSGLSEADLCRSIDDGRDCSPLRHNTVTRHDQITWVDAAPAHSIGSSCYTKLVQWLARVFAARSQILVMTLESILQRRGQGLYSFTSRCQFVKPLSRCGPCPIDAIEFDPMAGRRHMQVPTATNMSGRGIIRWHCKPTSMQNEQT